MNVGVSGGMNVTVSKKLIDKFTNIDWGTIFKIFANSHEEHMTINDYFASAVCSIAGTCGRVIECKGEIVENPFIDNRFSPNGSNIDVDIRGTAICDDTIYMIAAYLSDILKAETDKEYAAFAFYVRKFKEYK